MTTASGREGASGGNDLRLRQFVWLWNRCQGLATPSLHLEIADWLDRCWQDGERRLILLAFRSAGKSTLVATLCAWLLLGNPDLRILVLAAEHDLATKMVRNVRRIIERHPLTGGLVPKRAEQWAADQFTVARRLTLRDPSLLARGIGANITGLRADVVICDDVEVPNTSSTAGKRGDLRQRLMEISYILVPGGLQLFVGTPHSYYSIYAEQAREEVAETTPFLAGFRRLCVPLLDGDGKSRWPDRFTAQRIEEMRRQSGPAKFESQMLLQPRSAGEVRLDPSLLVPYDTPLDYREGNGQAVLSIGGRRM
ncbi:MAG: phage terminase large subunit, partial [Geminicoccaceae bacterium]